MNPKIGPKIGPILGPLLEELWVPFRIPKLIQNWTKTVPKSDPFLEGLLVVLGRLPADFQGILGATEARKYGFPIGK